MCPSRPPFHKPVSEKGLTDDLGSPKRVGGPLAL